MILIIHKKGLSVKGILYNNEAITGYSNQSLSKVLWTIAKKYPNEIIAWGEEKIVPTINSYEAWQAIFQNDRVMVSYSVNTCFLPEAIGYVDQLPFVNVNREVKFPTWQMSSDVGGIKGVTLLKFKSDFETVEDFTYLINSIAKIGQQNGLFCYSEPSLITYQSQIKPISTASISQLYSFVFQHYNSVWTSILLCCYIKYERSLPIIPYLQAFFYKKKFKLSVELGESIKAFRKTYIKDFSVDVIIPTLGRKEYLIQVLEDLKNQILFPKKIIIIEQNPDINSKSELNDIIQNDWPFTISHHFIHQTGACNARNIALKEVDSKWVFFADDDIRISSDFLYKSSIEFMKYGFIAINFNCKQVNEVTVFPKIKQWGSFGSGTSIVQSDYAKKCEFSMLYENGYGEDTDFGMQLRNVGCDIIYHPNIEILHLKAPIGGFRQKSKLLWENEIPLPKPAPTLMSFINSYFTPSQILGFKTSLFIKYYPKQSIKNPFQYVKTMRLQWQKSVFWANELKKINT